MSIARGSTDDRHLSSDLYTNLDAAGAMLLSFRGSFLVFGIMVIAFLLYEARFGYALGVSRNLCEAVGGKPAPASSRCITRTCFWFGDCGTWANAGAFREKLTTGDPVSKVVFWLGDPDRVEGSVYIWPAGKGDVGDFRVTFADGRLVLIER